MRPDWTVPRYNQNKINLSNNICYDAVLYRQISQLKFEPETYRQYADEALVYDVLFEHYNISPYQIAVGYGIGELITRVLRLPIIQDIVIVSPTWNMTEIYCKLYNIKHTIMSYPAFNSNTCFIANPNGINGSCVDQDYIEQLCKNFELVIVDEAYIDWVDEYENISSLKLLQKYKNLIILHTFSKSLGLAGLRFGYAFGSIDIIKQLQTMRPSCVMNNTIIPHLKDLFEYKIGHLWRMKETRTYIEANYDCTPSQGNYVLFNKIPKGVEETFILKGNRMALCNKSLFKDAIGD